MPAKTRTFALRYGLRTPPVAKTHTSMVAQTMATAANASRSGRSERRAARPTARSMDAASKRTTSSESHAAGAIARSRRVKATRIGAASSIALRMAERCWATSSAS